MKYLIVMAVFLSSVIAQAETLILEVEVTGGEHRLVREWTVTQDFPMLERSPSGEMIAVHVWQNRVLSETFYVRPPATVRSPLDQDGFESEHQVQETPTGLYHIRVPFSADYTEVTLEQVGRETSQRSMQSGLSSEPLLRIPLKN